MQPHFILLAGEALGYLSFIYYKSVGRYLESGKFGGMLQLFGQLFQFELIHKMS